MNEQYIDFQDGNARHFTSIIETMEELYNIVEITFKEDKLVMKATDPAMVAISKLEIPVENRFIDTYKGTGEKVAFNIKQLNRLLKPAREDIEELKLSYNKVGDSEVLQLKTQTRFGSLTAPIEQKEKEKDDDATNYFGDLDFENKVETKFIDLVNALDVAVASSDAALVKINNDGLEIKTSNDLQVRVAHKANNLEEESSTSVSLNYLSRAVSENLLLNKSYDIGKEQRIEIHQGSYPREHSRNISGDFPVKFVLSNENYSLKTVIAPRIKED